MPTARYAEKIRLAMKTANNPTGQPITLRQLANMTGYSYEHCRKVYNAEPIGSRPFNDVLCQALGLDKDEMWALAQQEKVSFRLGTGFLTQMPKDKRLVELWPRLTTADQDKVITIIEGFVYAKEAAEAGAKFAPKPSKAKSVVE